MEKNQRQEALLRAIVQEYVKTAHPVSSKILVEQYGFDFSPATIRNDMAELETAGYITQPHTSAGRVPTEKGYQYYIQHFLEQKELHQKEKKSIDEVIHQKKNDEREFVKKLAKTVSDVTHETVVISLNGEDYFTTGISYMFQKPEFAEHAEMMVELGGVFDRVDQIMEDVQEMIDQEIEVFIGEQNPFFHRCAVVVSEYEFDSNTRGVFGILGPMRMDYETNIAILQYMESLIEKDHER